MMKILLLLIFCACLPSFSQLEGINWVFGGYCGLKFSINNDSETKFNFVSGFANNGLSCMSNSEGKLILFCQGEKLTCFDYNSQPKYYNLNGNPLSYQSSQILKQYNEYNNQYLLLLADNFVIDTKYEFSYSIIETNNDSCLNFIKKDIVVRNNVGQRLASYFDKIDSSYTILISNFKGDSIIVYKFDKYGNYSLINKHKMNTLQNITMGNQGAFRLSPNGRKLAVSFYENQYIYVFDFDIISGNLTNKKTITNFGSSSNPFSLEFSPNSKYLYVTFSKGTNRLGQYNINLNSEFQINTSFFPISNEECSGIQLAPNGKIYIFNTTYISQTIYDGYYLHRLNSPNKNGYLCDIENKLILYSAIKSSHFYGLPYFPASMFYFTFSSSISSNSPVCYSDTIRLSATFDVDTSKIDCYWTGPNGFASNAKNPKFVYLSENQNGWYYLRAVHNVSDFEKIDSVFILNYKVHPTKIISSKSANLCQGDTVEFTSSITESSVVDRNIWTSQGLLTQQSLDKIQVYKTAWYYLKSIDENGCISYDSIYLNFTPKPKSIIGIIGNLALCQGDSVKLFIKDKLPNVDYYWEYDNSILNSDTIIIRKANIYKLIVKDKTINSCADSSEVEVKELISGSLNIVGNQTICEGGNTKLEIVNPPIGVSIKWSTGETSNSIEVFKAGLYWCEVSINNCVIADTIQVTVNPKPVINITGDSTICKNATGVLTLNGSYTSCTWSSGETTQSITITKAGIYSAQAENEFGCKTTTQIEVKEISNNIDLSKFQDIDFGKTKINEATTKELDLTGINPSNIKLLNNTDFTFIRNGNKLEITYKAAKKGIAEDSLLIAIDKPCQETLALKLKAEAEGEQIITLKVSDIEVLAGDTDVPLPITYKLNNNITLPQTITWTAKLSYKTAIYYPDIAGDVQSANRNLDIILSGTKTLTKKEDTLTIIRGNTFLADTIFTKVDFNEFTVNPGLTISKEDGSIKIVGMCAPKIRPIEFFTPTSLSIKPNPTSGEVDIEFISETKGETIIKLYNSAGARVYTETKLKMSQSILFHFDNIDLPNGIYQVQIEQSGVNVQSGSLVIEK